MCNLGVGLEIGAKPVIDCWVDLICRIKGWRERNPSIAPSLTAFDH